MDRQTQTYRKLFLNEYLLRRIKVFLRNLFFFLGGLEKRDGITHLLNSN